MIHMVHKIRISWMLISSDDDRIECHKLDDDYVKKKHPESIEIPFSFLLPLHYRFGASNCVFILH
ncbi:hypothetical protein DERF_014370, partial [Dermatophagoides farinae]